jgi:hypothetical protein
MCVAKLKSSGDRPWFAAYDAAGVTLSNNSSINCESWLDEVRTTAARIKDTVDRATETARQRGVFPGTVRDLRRRQRLDWSGWDR